MTTTAKRSYAEIVSHAFATAPERVPVCLLHENMLNVRATKAGTQVTLGVPAHIFTPDDAVWFTSERGPTSRKPKYVGVVVFVPTELYEAP